MSRRPRVTVLMGGASVEREVSLVSGAACALGLEEAGYEVTRLEVGDDLVAMLAASRPEVVFNALHGRFGEDGRVQGLLDLLGVPYTHSGLMASAVAMDKPLAKALFEGAGLRCPEGVVTSLAAVLERLPIAPPVVVKPAAEGSSVGVYILPEGDLRPLRQRNDLDPRQRVLVERFVPGRELTCAVLGTPGEEEALAVTELRPHEGFYDYRAKYTDGITEHILPAAIPEEIEARVRDWSLKAHRLLGCRAASRADFRWDDSRGEAGLHLLEINTQPGMTPLSLLPEQAAYRGIGFPQLVARLVEMARCDR